MSRGYGSGVILRENIIERVRQYYAEIEQLQKDIDDSERKLFPNMETGRKSEKPLGFL